MRKVLLLGASGNIGSQTIDLLLKDPESFELVGVSVGHQIEKIPSILASFPSIKYLCVQEESDYETLQKSSPTLNLYWGDEGLKEIIQVSNADMVVNALVGFSGLVPTLTTLQNDKILCLANKESLVVGGDFVKRLLRAGKGILYPIDSEHVAIAKCLSKVKRGDVSEFLITASGGAFRGLSRDELASVTPEMALHHPTWNMGPKITIDSDTMFNKGFELIEAHYLFDWPTSKMRILLHDESYVHSLILLNDGTYVADVGKPDMHGPIAYALYEGKAPFEAARAKDIKELGPYHFHAFDEERYPAVEIALNAIKEGGNRGAVLNAAVEEADHLFLKGKLPFIMIEKVVSFALKSIPNVDRATLRDILEADAYTRLLVKRRFGHE